jgi:hypothetical protein
MQILMLIAVVAVAVLHFRVAPKYLLEHRYDLID